MGINNIIPKNLWKDKAGGGIHNYNELFEDEYLLQSIDDREEQSKYQFEYSHPYFKHTHFIINTIPGISNEDDTINHQKKMSLAISTHLPKEYISFIHKRYSI